MWCSESVSFPISFCLSTAATTGNTSKGPVEVRFVALLMKDAIVRFMFVTPHAEAGRLSTELRRTTYSFRPLSPQEREAVKGLKLRVHTVRRGDTVESLAAALPFDDYKVERFRVLNGLAGNTPLPPAGSKVKIVV